MLKKNIFTQQKRKHRIFDHHQQPKSLLYKHIPITTTPSELLQITYPKNNHISHCQTSPENHYNSLYQQYKPVRYSPQTKLIIKNNGQRNSLTPQKKIKNQKIYEQVSNIQDVKQENNSEQERIYKSQKNKKLRFRLHEGYENMRNQQRYLQVRKVNKYKQRQQQNEQQNNRGYDNYKQILGNRILFKKYLQQVVREDEKKLKNWFLPNKYPNNNKKYYTNNSFLF